MAAALDNFLLRFGETVKEAVQDSLGAEVEKMVVANLRASELAEEVNAKFLNASGNIVAGANTFQRATSTLNDGQFSEKFTQATNNLVNSQEKLEKFIYGLEIAIKSSNQASQNAIGVCAAIEALDTRVTEVMQAIHANQTDFSSIAQNLRQGSQDFLAVQNILTSVVGQIEQVQTHVYSKSEELSQIQTELSNLVTLFNQANATTITNQNNLNSAILQMKEANSAVAENLNLGANQFTEITGTVESLTTRVEQLGASLNNRAELQNRAQQELMTAFTAASNTMNSLVQKINTLSTESNTRSNQLSSIRDELAKLSRLFNEVQRDTRQNTNNFSSQLDTFSSKLSALTSAIDFVNNYNSALSQQYQNLSDSLNVITRSIQNLNAKPIAETLNTIKTVLDKKL
jgi:chromosome segregation ATPase